MRTESEIWRAEWERIAARKPHAALPVWSPPEPKPATDVWCDLCGERATPDDFSREAGMVVCPHCIEDML